MECHSETPLPRRRIAEGQLFAVGKRIKRQQLYPSASGDEQTVNVLQLADSDILGACQRLCIAVRAFPISVLLEPVEAEAALRIQISLLTLIVIGDGAVNCLPVPRVLTPARR